MSLFFLERDTQEILMAPVFVEHLGKCAEGSIYNVIMHRERMLQNAYLRSPELTALLVVLQM